MKDPSPKPSFTGLSNLSSEQFLGRAVSRNSCFSIVGKTVVSDSRLVLVRNN